VGVIHRNLFPLTLILSPAFAEAATRRQALGGEEIVWLLSAEYHLIKKKGGIYEKGFGFGFFCYGYGQFNHI